MNFCGGTKNGSPQIDQRKVCSLSLLKELSRNQKLLKIGKFRLWYENNAKNQEMGREMLVTLHAVMSQQFDLLYKTQLKYEEAQCSHSSEMYIIHQACLSLIAQTEVAENLQIFFREKTGKDFIFQAPCQRLSSCCHQRRVSAGGENHSHPIKFVRPSINFLVYNQAAARSALLTAQGLSAATGPSVPTEQRCFQLESRLLHFSDLSQKARYDKVCRKQKPPNIKATVRNFVHSHMTLSLENAITSNNFDAIERFVCRGASPNHEMASGTTPLIQCTIMTNRAKALKLVEKGALLDYWNHEGMSALCWAAARENLIMIHTLLECGAQPSLIGPMGMNAIFVAVRHGRLYALELMVKNITESENPRTVQDVLNTPLPLMGTSPLTLCVIHGMRKMVRSLLIMGARVDVTDANGRCAIATAHDYGWIELYQWLIEQKESTKYLDYHFVEKEEEKERLAIADFTYAVKKGYAVQDGLHDHAAKKRLHDQVLKGILSGLVPPDYEFPCGMTALMFSAKAGNLEHVNDLIRYGCDPCYSSFCGRNALIEAATSAQENSLHVCLLLIGWFDHCFDKRDINGNSALSEASKQENKELVELFLTCHRKGVEATLEEYKRRLQHTQDKVS